MTQFTIAAGTACTTKNCPFSSSCERRKPHNNISGFMAFPLSKLLSGSTYCEYYLSKDGTPLQEYSHGIVELSNEFANAVNAMRDE